MGGGPNGAVYRRRNEARARAALLAGGGPDRWPWLLEGHGRGGALEGRPPAGVLAALGSWWPPDRSGWWGAAARCEAERCTVRRALAVVRAARCDPRDRPTSVSLARELARTVDRWRLEAGVGAREAAPAVLKALEMLRRWAESEIVAR